MPLGRHADCGLGHIHAMRCACFAGVLQHGLSAPHIHALAAASIQKRHLSRHNAYKVPYAEGFHSSNHMTVAGYPTLPAMQSARVPQHGLNTPCTVHSSP